MLKLVQLKISKIKYTGDSIGDDILAEFEILNKFLRIDKKVKNGATAVIDKEIGRFETDQKIFWANLRIVVIEKDPLFNDVGNLDANIKIDTSIIKPQQLVYKIQIKETRSIFGKVWGKSVADFEIILEASVTDSVKYIPDNGDGWLKVRIEDTKSEE